MKKIDRFNNWKYPKIEATMPPFKQTKKGDSNEC